MKYLGLILVVALVAGQVLTDRINENNSMLREHTRGKRNLSDKLETFIENLKILLREGNETLGIPILDPFVSEGLGVTLDEDRINGTAELSNFRVDGLAGYNVDTAKISILKRKLTIGLTWPQIYSKGSYKFNLDALNRIQAFGDGDYEVTLTDLSFNSEIWVGIAGDVRIKEMQTSISLGGLALEADGILGDDEISGIVSDVVSEMLPKLIEDYQRELTEAVNKIVMQIVNEMLKGMSIADIIAILG